MPRANRYFCAGHIWHITHRCHSKAFLLKFARDRKRWRYWLFQAKKRYGLCVLNYVITSNHIHLLVVDDGRNEISASMQLIAGRIAQEFNKRKNRGGAFWEDRYHATAVQSDEHLIRCLIYIDLNMVRAGVVGHPQEWPDAGYKEIQSPPTRYRIIDQQRLLQLTRHKHWQEFSRSHERWICENLKNPDKPREPQWTECIAVGNKAYVQKVQTQLGALVKQRSTKEVGVDWMLKEPRDTYQSFLIEKPAL
ncbi:MAG: transposase [Gammaproteobacteria bacterium]|jgi:putative transposase|nr:transposase [Chromatiales bacterium]MDP6675802.1 transposase [Gammaproteobacteria bacterium]